MEGGGGVGVINNPLEGKFQRGAGVQTKNSSAVAGGHRYFLEPCISYLWNKKFNRRITANHGSF